MLDTKMLKDMADINEKFLMRAMKKMQSQLMSSDADFYDCECFEMFSQAIDNIKDLSKIQKLQDEESTMYKEHKLLKDKYMLEDALVKSGSDGGEEYLECVESLKDDYTKEKATKFSRELADLLGAIKIMHPSMYEGFINHLKNM